MKEELRSATGIMERVAIEARTAERREVTDLIGVMDEVTTACQELIVALTRRDTQLQEEEDQGEIMIEEERDMDMDLTSLVETWDEILAMGSVSPPRARQRRYNPDQLEMLFAGGMLNAIMNTMGGRAMLSRQTGVPEATLSRWRDKVRDDRDWRPWRPRVIHADRRTLLSRGELAALSQWLRENPEVEEGMMTALDFLPVLRTWWEQTHPGGNWPGCHIRTARRIGHRLGLAWRRAHPKTRPTADEDRKSAFLEEIRELLRSVPKTDVINADEAAFLLYMTGFYRWARRGIQGVQIPTAGNQKLTYTVMVAVTAALTKLPIRVIVKGKTTRAERALGDAVANVWDSDHTKTGWMNLEAMLRWLHRLRELPEYADGHRVHLILDTYAAHRCQEVRDMAESLNIQLHFIPAGATDTMQPLDRYVFGAMKASYRRIYMRRLAEHGPRKLTKRDFLIQLMAAWEAVNVATLARAWDIYETH